jgi:hypothetical protein
MKRNIFSGFHLDYFAAAPSLTSFLFTPKNPQGFPAQRFALKAEKKHEAIWCNSTCGPYHLGIAVDDNCNTNTDSYTCPLKNVLPESPVLLVSRHRIHIQLLVFVV